MPTEYKTSKDRPIKRRLSWMYDYKTKVAPEEEAKEPWKPVGVEVRSIQDCRFRFSWMTNTESGRPRPSHYVIYSDSGNGPIDYDNPIAIMKACRRPVFYSWISEPFIQARGNYVHFDVRARTSDGVESLESFCAAKALDSHPRRRKWGDDL